MKDVLKVFLLIVVSIVFYIALYLIGGINPFILSITAIILSVIIIVGGIIILSKNKKHSHRLPKDKEKEYNKWYKDQSKKEL